MCAFTTNGSAEGHLQAIIMVLFKYLDAIGTQIKAKEEEFSDSPLLPKE